MCPKPALAPWRIQDQPGQYGETVSVKRAEVTHARALNIHETPDSILGTTNPLTMSPRAPSPFKHSATLVGMIKKSH